MRRTVHGRTQAEVRAKFRDARERIESGAPVEEASMPVAAWLEDRSTRSLAAGDRKQATKDLDATLARTHLVPTVGTMSTLSSGVGHRRAFRVVRRS